MQSNKHPRDRFITIFGRKPVLEVLQTPDIKIDKVFIVKNAKGELIDEIFAACRQLGIEPLKSTAAEVSKISKSPTQDQGIAADVIVPAMNDFEAYLYENQHLPNQGIMAIDGVTTPANVGLIIRSCTGLGMDGILLPRKGASSINSLVIKASAGVIFKSPLLKCEQLPAALAAAKKQGFRIYGLSLSPQAKNFYQTAPFAPKSIFIMGNESLGISPQVAQYIDEALFIEMHNGVESLNVACTASIVAAEWRRKISFLNKK